MFAVTKRLSLRPGWSEDAPELARAIGHWEVVRNLGSAPWPYGEADAAELLARPIPGIGARLLVCERMSGRIVGCVGFGPRDGQDHEFGYWITPDCWGLGYATEAGRAMIAIARAMGMTRLEAAHFLDNPASGRVLAKLGFRPTGTSPHFSLARGGHAPCADFVLDLSSRASAMDRLAA